MTANIGRSIASQFPEDAPPEALFRFNVKGVKIEVPRALLQQDLWDAFTDGSYEAEELAALTFAVRPNDTVVELGSGVGYISTHMLKNLGAGHVVAIEADPRLIPVIRRTHELNGVTAVVKNAVAARANEMVTFNERESFWASSVVALSGSRRVILPAEDIQAIAESVRPDVIVADIQGSEATIFEGLAMPTVRHLVIEVHKAEIGLKGIAACIAHLATAGFTYDPNGSSRTNIVFSRVTV